MTHTVYFCAFRTMTSYWACVDRHRSKQNNSNLKKKLKGHSRASMAWKCAHFAICHGSGRNLLPATTIFSCLPLRARSLLGISVLCAIGSSAASNAVTRNTQTVCVCAEQDFGENNTVFRDASMWASARGAETRRRTRRQHEYSSRVGNVVRSILTNQGVNMTLAQKPTVRERN